MRLSESTSSTRRTEGVSARRPPGRPSDPALDEALIDAAVTVLAATGYSGLTTAAVARQAGTSTATLYRRWRSKGALVADAAAHLATRGVPDVDTGSLAGDLVALLTHKTSALAGDVGRALAILIGEAVHDERIAEALHAHVWSLSRQRVEAMVSRARARGDAIGDIDLDAFTVLVVSAALAPTTTGGLLAPEAFTPLLLAAIGVPHVGQSG